MGSPEDRRRWGILGGAFDPIHRGHLQLAQDCQTQRQLDQILIVPSYTPPHKPEGCVASFDDRCAMIARAIESHDTIELCKIERELDGPGYTLHLVRELKKRYPAVDFFFIIGADNILEMTSWHRPEEIFREVTVLAGTRPGYELSREGLPAGFDVELVSTTAIDISATVLRDQLARDTLDPDLTDMLPEGVLAYIRERKLYSHG